MNRIATIARLQALGRRDALLWPPAILLLAFAANLTVFATISEQTAGQDPVTGALASIYFTCLAFGALGVTQHFPFALGMSVTRREFTAGTAAFIAFQTTVYSALLVLLQAVEHATNGWGIHLRFFGLGLMEEHSVPARFVMYAVPLLFMTLIGTTAGTLYLRWRTNGLLTAIAALVLLLGGTAALLGRLDAWPAIGHWLTHTSPLLLFAAWPWLLIVALATGSWLALRHATA